MSRPHTNTPRNRKSASKSPPPNRREYVQALQRGFAVIKAFSATAPSLTMAEVAQRAGLARTVARRYLFTLAELGCIQEHDGRFTLTPKVLDLGFTYLSTMSVATIAQPTMERVVADLHESCSLSVLDGHEIVYVARVAAKRIMSINLVVGSRLPAHATSMGKILLAHLPAKQLDAFLGGELERRSPKTMCDPDQLRAALDQARCQGWALADEESEEGIRSVAAPVWEHGGRVAAAINVSAHASRVSKAELCEHHLPILLDAARAISRAMGGSR